MRHADPGGAASPFAPPPPPLATALNAVEEDAYFCDNINFWNIFPAECKTLLLSRDIDNTHLKLQDGLD